MQPGPQFAETATVWSTMGCKYMACRYCKEMDSNEHNNSVSSNFSSRIQYIFVVDARTGAVSSKNVMKPQVKSPHLEKDVII